MKRPLGWIGLCFLSVLAVIFWFGEALIMPVLICSAVMFVCGMLFILVKRFEKLRAYLAVIGATAFVASSFIFLYQNYYVQPIIKDYSEKELNIKGYVCDEIELQGSVCSHLIRTEEINGEPKSLKIRVNTFSEYDISEFDEIRATVFAEDSANSKLYSRRIFLEAYEDDGFVFEATGETHGSIYQPAVAMRKGMKRILSSMLSETGRSVTRAVLLGDRQALDPKLRKSFTQSGISYLIVVSGMHLTVVVGLMMFLLRNLRNVIRSVAAVVTVILFAAVTGFSPSVIRAGICVIITYIGYAVLRTSDGITSLGIAALVLTVTNPYSVGDLGMLLSFSATLGILMWASPLYDFLQQKLRLTYDKKDSPKRKRIKRVLLSLIALLTTSVSASLWSMPISIPAFGRMSPLVVPISLIASPLATLILSCAVLLIPLSILPSMHLAAGILACITDGLCLLISGFVSSASKLPFSSVKADEPYIYIWLAVSIILVIAGMFIKRKRAYVPIAAAVSLFTLCGGCILSTVFADDATFLTVYQSGSGTAVVSRRLDSYSVLSCGGKKYVNQQIADYIELSSPELECMVLPNKYSRYSQIMPYLVTLDVKCAAVFEEDRQHIDCFEARELEPYLYDRQTSFSVALNGKAADRVISTPSATFQYITGEATAALIVPKGADAQELPVEYRSADIIIIEDEVKNDDCLSCETLIYSAKNADLSCLSARYETAVPLSDSKYSVRLQ